jgi:alpha-amylase
LRHYTGCCFYACNSTDDLQGPTAEKALSKVIDVTHHDGHPFSTGKSMTTTTTGKYVANPGGGVMMQAFYWDVPAGGNWWNTGTKVTAWSNAGIGSIWLPPVSKAKRPIFYGI